MSCDIVYSEHKITEQMWKQFQMGLRAFLHFTQKIWSFICYVLKKQIRVVSLFLLDVESFKNILFTIRLE